MGQRKIVMLASLDTKGPESQYLRDCIEEQGAETILVDIGYGRPAQLAADISAGDVAIAAGSTIESVYAMKDTSERSNLMMQGATIRVLELLRQGNCDGIIAFGGASNTTLATGVMKELPVGVPKLMISSAAAIPAYSAMFFGSTDITIMHSVVDLSGLNDLTRSFLKQGAGGIRGLAAASNGRIDHSQCSKMVAVTSFRFAEDCSRTAMRALESRGYIAIPFHAQGVGEDAMENLVAQGLFEGVLDIVPAGLSEQMLGGNRAARPNRLEAAGRAGVPQVIATSGFDMISCGPISRREGGDPLWEKRALATRRYSIPDRFRVEVRTTADEVADIARCVAEKLNQAKGAASVMVPVLGWSSLSVKGADLYDPAADAVFVPTLKETLKEGVAVVEIQAELNSEQFAHASVDELHGMIEAKKAQRASAPGPS